jgi:Putative bacterial sensory transduction regulator
VSTDPQAAAVAEVRAALAELDLEWQETGPGLFTVRLPGTHKLVTECALEVGRHRLGIRAFVARRPEQNEAAVYRWLLEHNLKLYAVAFAVDRLGDIYLTGKVPLEQLSRAEVDRVLGVVAATADASFDPLVELGFADSIRREWVWRRSRGESTANLEAFRHLDPGPDTPSP